METQEAISILHNGHAIWSVQTAKDVCEAIGVRFDAELIDIFHSENPEHPLGLIMREGNENSPGVEALNLSHYVAKFLGVDKEAGSYLGRGTQASAYGDVVASKLGYKFNRETMRWER